MRPILCLVFAAACAREGTEDDTACVLNAFFIDLDGDGHGDPIAEVVSACTQPEGYARLGDDCDDTNPAVHGDADEICDGIDNDCDDAIDEDAVDATVWYTDTDGDLYGDSSTALSSCAQPAGPVVDVGGDCDDTAFAVNPGQDELCNGLDDDCDDLVDADDDSLLDGVVLYEDTDSDGFGDDATATPFCDAPDGWVETGGDCDDDAKQVHPGHPELCDGVDDDCDDLTDDDDPDVHGVVEIYADSDGDTFGDAAVSRSACSVLAGYVQNDDDCDDTTSAVGKPLQYYRDYDGDGYGSLAAYSRCAPGPSDVLLNGDCEITDASINPGATEICDGIDNDCNGLTDEDDPGLVYTVWYADSDRDGYGTSSDTVESCQDVSGYVQTSGDCDDGEASANPAGIEWCDSIDNDCNALVDDDVVTIDWYVDSDGDGYGDSADETSDCVQPKGYVATAGDCDDAAADISPGAPDLCESGVDEDCDGATDNCRVDLAAADFTIVAGYLGDQLGTSLATADLDADGVADLAIGAPGSSPQGKIYLIFGPSSGGGEASLFPTLYGDPWTLGIAEIGQALAAGDADDDGFDDLVVGAPGVDSAYLFVGPLTGSHEVVDADATLTVSGSFGSSIAVVSDVDGDAVPDIVVGAPDAGTSGSIFVVSGTTTGNPVVTSAATYRYDGPSADARVFGVAIADPGDLDGDGIDELAIAASKRGDGGLVYIFPGGVAAGTYDAASEAASTIEGSSTGAFGKSMTATVYDGDGSTDLLVGDEYADYAVGDPSGSVYAFLGPVSGSLDTSDAQVQWIPGSTDAVGLGAVAAGDVDADGAIDVLIGAAQSLDSQGLVFLQLGFVSGSVDADTLPSLYSSSGETEQLGSSLALVPDWDGDGGDEIAIGAPLAQGTISESYDAGCVYVLFTRSFLP
jgi:hypothetical protein